MNTYMNQLVRKQQHTLLLKNIASISFEKLIPDSNGKKIIKGLPHNHSNITLSNIPPILNNHTSLAILLGTRSYLICIDIDIPKLGEEHLYNGAQFYHQHLSHLNTPMARTTSGGYHVFFKYTDLIKCGVKVLFKGQKSTIDILGNGKFVICYPSTFNGKQYQWIKSFEDYEPIEIPQDFLTFFETKALSVPTTTLPEFVECPDKEIEFLVECLSADTADNYLQWIKVGLILKTLLGDNGYFLFESFSQKSSKFDERQCYWKWTTFGDSDMKGMSVGSLKKMAKTDNPEGYQKYYEKSRKTQKKDSPPHIDAFNPLNEFQDFKPNIRKEEFVQIDSDGNLIVIARTGRGKTCSMKNFIKSVCKKVPIISLTTRRSLADKLSCDFGFKNYQTMKMTDYTNQATHRIVVSIDSLHKLRTCNINNDFILILDEFGTLFQQLNSSTLDKYYIDSILQNFKFLLQNATRIIALDATAVLKDILLLQKWSKQEFNIDYYINPTEYSESCRTTILHKKKHFITLLEKAVMDGKKFVLTCVSKRKAVEYKLKLENLNPNLKIAVYTADTENHQELTDVNNTWLKYDVVIYNGKIDRGISFDVRDYFDCCYADFSGGRVITPDNGYQLLRRCRYYKTAKYFVLCPEIKQYTHIDIQEFEELIEQRGWAQKHNLDPYNDCFKIPRNKESVLTKNDYYYTWLFQQHFKHEAKKNWTWNFISWLKYDGHKIHHFNAKKDLPTIEQEVELFLIEDAFRNLKTQEFVDVIWDMDYKEGLKEAEMIFEKVKEKQELKTTREKVLLLYYYYNYYTGINPFLTHPYKIYQFSQNIPEYKRFLQLKKLQTMDLKDVMLSITEENGHFKDWLEDKQYQFLKKDPIILKILMLDSFLLKLGLPTMIAEQKNPKIYFEALNFDDPWIKNNLQFLNGLFVNRNSNIRLEELKNFNKFSKWINGKLGWINMKLGSEGRKRRLNGKFIRSYADFAIEEKLFPGIKEPDDEESDIKIHNEINRNMIIEQGYKNFVQFSGMKPTYYEED